MTQEVGKLSARVVSLLGSSMNAGQPIYLGPSNIAHMQSRHPGDYAKYGQYIPQILAQPDYVGENPKDGSIEYVKDFLGVQTMIITSEIPQNTVIAIPADNIVEYYIDPADAGFQALGLNYTTANGDTNLIGVHKEGNYGRVMGETHALMGIEMMAEYIDAIAVIKIVEGN
jgi:hypothetical protein